jgi:hypothetical protein
MDKNGPKKGKEDGLTPQQRKERYVAPDRTASLNQSPQQTNACLTLQNYACVNSFVARRTFLCRDAAALAEKIKRKAEAGAAGDS